MSLHGKSLVAGALRPAGPATFSAYNPLLGKALEPAFEEAADPLVEEALHAAQLALAGFRRSTPERRAVFLETIATEILGLGDAHHGRAQATS